MRNYVRQLFFFAALAGALPVFSQETAKPLTKSVIVTINVFSLVAQRPTVTLGKFFGNSFSTEISFVQGRFNNFLFTDHYDYSGFLIRAKKYFTDVRFGNLSPYAALYVGSLKRTIQTTGRQIGNNGWIGYPSRDFSANSIRGGGSLGIAYISRGKIIVDGLVSLGYGTYTKVYKPDLTRNANGYVDAQLWLSVGYCF